jgi:predicted AAA+ superfamily ATPase
MEIAIEERIGARELFTNRQDELAYFDSWISDIDRKAAISTAIVGHRKVGKTALLQRLFNQLLGKRERKVIPFLFEIKEQPFLIDEFSRLYYSSFISQLLSFKKRQWLGTTNSLEKLLKISAELQLDYVIEDLMEWQRHAEVGGGILWTYTNEAPHRLAEISGERILVMIDEFQYINKYIYHVAPFVPENQLTTLAGSYLGTSESRIAPMLITGSAIGMLVTLIHRQLPKRFKFYHLKKFKEQDFLELGYKLSVLYNVPVTDECLLQAHRLLDGHPAYLRDIFDSQYEKKDLATTQGLYETYFFEVQKPKQGRILAGWEEYIDLAFEQINQRHAKKIVLFLAKHSDRDWSRMEIKERCGLHDMDDQELEQKLQALVAGDLIAPGRSPLYYQGLGDPTFEKVFRLKYEEEIEQIDFEATKQDMRREFEEANRRLKEELAAKTVEANRLRGELNQKKGEIGELWIKSVLKHYSNRGRYFAPGELGNNAEKVRLPRFKKIEAFSFVGNGLRIEVDVFCEPVQQEDLHLAVEVKNREVKHVGVDEVDKFAANLQALQEHLGVMQLQGLFYSFNGFQPAVVEKLRELKIFWWDYDTLQRLS